MRKKFVFKLIFLTPIIALFLASSAFFFSSYPQSLASVDNFITNIPENIDSLVGNEPTKEPPPTLPQPLNEETLALLESRIRANIIREIRRETLQPISHDTARTVLAYTVLISRDSAKGTGVVVYENKVGDTYYSYILTNQHVVADAEEVEITRFRYLRNASISSRVNYTGRVINHDSSLDLALIELQTAESIGPAAEFDSASLQSNLTLYQPIYVAGCPLGNPPLITNGNVAFISNTRNIITAFSIFGSSGGGVFTREGKLVSIVRGITMVRLENNVQVPETNLTHVIPGPLVRSWLITEGLSFILRDGTHEVFLTNRESQKRSQKKTKKTKPKKKTVEKSESHSR